MLGGRQGSVNGTKVTKQKRPNEENGRASLGQYALVVSPAGVYSETGRTQWLEGTNTEGPHEESG